MGEFIVAKAIRDGVMDAVVDAETGVVTTNEVGDVYSSSAPLDELSQRISFCFSIHDDAVRAMRYPDVKSKAVVRGDADEEDVDDLDLVDALLYDEDDLEDL